MEKEIKVLDHGYVRFIDSMGTDETIIEAARMSTGRGFERWEPGELCERGCGETPESCKPSGYVERLCYLGEQHSWKKVTGDAKLLEFLYKNGHSTPFEMCELAIEVQAPIFVFREWHRHRTQCLSGDTRITCSSPTGATFKRTIKEIYDLKHGGVADRAPKQHKNGTSKAGTPVFRPARRKDAWRYRVLPNCQERTLRVLNEATGEFETGSMAEVWESGVKELFLLSVNGHSIKTSAEHPFFTRRGWVKMKDIVVGDQLARMGKIAANERPIPPSLRQGIGVWTTMMRTRLIKDIDNCYVCGCSFPKSSLELDHVIPVADDLSKALEPSNLKPVCPKCHRAKTDTEQPSRDGMTRRGVRWERVSELPHSVGEEMTYDIELRGDHHNYIANDFVVHNSYNEFSARYAQMPNLHYLPENDRIQIQSTANKQGSGDAIPEWAAAEWRALLKDEQLSVYEHYDELVQKGIAKEIARLNTPVSRYSKMRAKTDLKNWLGFLRLRMAPNAQFEIRVFANAVAEIVKELWPRTYALFEEYELNAVRLSRTEVDLVRSLLDGKQIPPEAFSSLRARFGG